ncbi:restriction endonuclease subunit S [Vagococcus fluvialis]|uniref:restriction endonuclease subunit S n=1 Tax=Vagococcus fluvialis TaxID=2738 RepID=UPI003B5CB365
MIPENSIAVVTRVGVGKLSLIPFSYATSQDFLSFSGLSINNEFGLYSLYLLLQRKLNNIQGTSIKGITKSDLLNDIIQVPLESEEQTKIGNFFKQLDETITLQERKLDLLKEQKKGYLQKMFPKQNEKVPELRFSGFTDDWEQRKLKDVSEMYDNLRVPITASDRVSGDTPYYGSNGIQDYVEGYTHDGEYVLIAEDGANDLLNYPVNYVNGKVWINNHAHVVSGKVGELNNLFLVSRIKSMNIVPWLVGGGRAKLNGDVLKKLPILIPSFEEQQKIGNFFKQLDDTIDLQESKLEKMKEMKTGFLQKMFI